MEMAVWVGGFEGGVVAGGRLSCVDCGAVMRLAIDRVRSSG